MGKKKNRTKLTKTDVLFIKHWLSKNSKDKELAGLFNVSKSTIQAIKYKRIWANVGGYIA